MIIIFSVLLRYYPVIGTKSRNDSVVELWAKFSGRLFHLLHFYALEFLNACLNLVMFLVVFYWDKFGGVSDHSVMKRHLILFCYHQLCICDLRSLFQWLAEVRPTHGAELMVEDRNSTKRNFTVSCIYKTVDRWITVRGGPPCWISVTSRITIACVMLLSALLVRLFLKQDSILFSL